MERRDFLKYGAAGLAGLIVGSEMPWLLENPAYAAVQSLNFTITDAKKNMVTHNAINVATCYFWIYKCNTPNFRPDCPGPNIFTTPGDTINLSITNALDEPHAFFIPGGAGLPPVFDSGPIAPGATFTGSFVAPKAGSYLYYDNLNAPVNRVMGLHGAFIVMPIAPAAGHKFTPYDTPTLNIQKLFDDLGPAAWWPGLAWEQGDPATGTPAFRQHIWVLHQASPLLFTDVGNFTPGQDFPAATFVSQFLNSPYADTFHTGKFNRKAHFFTINGQSGHFSHNNPFICPMYRVGEPALIRVLNAGLHTHSCHIHANHVYVLSLDGRLSNNLWWVDTMAAHPGTGFDWLVPYMRPPDVPNTRGIGRADPPRRTQAGGFTWPPAQELATFIPPVGTLVGAIDLAVQMSPLCFPMHDHSEASQTAQGGNYNCGLISGINFTGDRNDPAGVLTFDNPPLTHGPTKTGPAAPPLV